MSIFIVSSEGCLKRLCPSLAAGLVENKVCAIADAWSGLRFVYRLADRPPKVARR